jgi:hypothetical protein
MSPRRSAFHNRLDVEAEARRRADSHHVRDDTMSDTGGPPRTTLPVDRFQPVAKIVRAGNGCEIRVGIADRERTPHHERTAYVAIPSWIPGQGGGMWPRPAGCILVRPREVEQLIVALEQALDELVARGLPVEPLEAPDPAGRPGTPQSVPYSVTEGRA